MKKLFCSVAVVLFVSIVVTGCGTSGDGTVLDPDWVQAATSGEISRSSSIRIQFTQPIGNELSADGLIQFEPAISGTAQWEDDYTLQFLPETYLPAEERYHATVKLPPEVTDGLDPQISFSFFTPAIQVTTENLTLEYEDVLQPDSPVIRGNLVFTDVMQPDEVQALMGLESPGQQLTVRWDSAAPGRIFSFHVGGIQRRTVEQDVAILLRNNEVSFSADAVTSVKVPARGDFEILTVRTRNLGGTVVEFVFSEPLAEDQDLRGLISLSEGSHELGYNIRNNLLRVYSSTRWPTSFTIEAHPGIVSAAGQVIADLSVTQIQLPTERPAVRFVGSGAIVPDADTAHIAVETRNLQGLMVQAIRVPDTMLHQFSQLNTLSQTNEMTRVGSVIWEKAIEVPWEAAHSDRFVRHGLDISELVAEHEPGLYHLVLTFRRPHIMYDSGEDYSDEEFEFPRWPDAPVQGRQQSNWDWYEINQRRSHRFDPTHDAFYEVWNDHNITISRNIYVSNIGLMAQQDEAGILRVQATELLTAEPLHNAAVEVLNYQQGILAAGTTNTSGEFSVQLKEYPQPFSVRVNHQGELSYLRLLPQDALNISHFDVSGERDHVEVQGFLYGERDVWRPGDTMHLTFVLRDQFQSLPDDHPVSLVVHDPRGNEVYRGTQTHGTQGLYYFPVATNSESPTGSYRAVVQVGPHQFEQQLRVETIVPNRLRIELDIDDEDGLIVDPRIQGSISSSWLHGAPAAGLKAEIDMTTSPAETRFSRFEGYVFDDPSRTVEQARSRVFEGQLDNDGHASFSNTMRVGSAPGMLNATLISRVYEPSGNFSNEFYTQLFSPYEKYVGMKVPRGDAARDMLLTDIEHEVEVAVVDSQGNPVSGRIRAELYKLNWRWWWETDAQNNPQYFQRQSNQSVMSRELTVDGGTGSFTFQVDYPSWGRYMLYTTCLDSGHRSAQVVYIDWPGWAGRAMDGPGDAPDVLTFTSDKPRYNVGDTATLTLPLGNQGRARVSLEANGRIIEEDWVEPKGSETQYRFAVTSEMLPNVYAHVTYIQPYTAENDRPLRSHGVIPLEIRDPATQLRPIITSSEVFAPGSTAQIRVREEDGKAMAYTLAVVDEGLLGITRYRSPDLRSHFYRRTASLLRSFDLYNQVAGAATGDLASLLAIGGSDSSGAAADDSLSRFEPVVTYHAPRLLAAGGENLHTIEIPEYLGAVRIMVVAVQQGSQVPQDAYGKAEREVFVRKPLMVLGTLPRVLSPGDEIILPASVFAMEPDIRNVEVSVAAEGLAQIEGNRTRMISFDQPGEKSVAFMGRVFSRVGEAAVTFTVRAGENTSVHRIPVEVRMPTAPETRKASITLEPGRQRSIAVETFGLIGSNAITLELSGFKPLDLERRLGYLIRYPYGCIEQTTSSVFPQLYLEDITSLSPDRSEQIAANIQDGISRLQSFQLSSGGFSFWPGSGSVNDWVSSYVGHFLLEARRRGYVVPSQLIDNWVIYQRSRANASSINSAQDALTQAYRLYVLALAGQPEIGAMNRLVSSRHLTNPSRWRLAAAYQLIGNRTQTDELLRSANTTQVFMHGQEGIYGSRRREEAMIAESMVLTGRVAQSEALIRNISDVLASDAGLSTQESAFMLMSVARYAQHMGTNRDIQVRSTWRGRSQLHQGSEYVVQSELDASGFGVQTGSLQLENLGSQPVQVRVLTRGNPAQGLEEAISNGYQLSLEYLIDDEPHELAQPLRSGDQLRARITVKNTRTIAQNDTAVSYMIPTGWEIVNARLANAPRNTRITYQDIRDDRVNSFLDLPAGGSVTIDIDLIATYAGRYYHPGVLAEAMYDPETMARTEGRWVEVQP